MREPQAMTHDHSPSRRAALAVLMTAAAAAAVAVPAFAADAAAAKALVDAAKGRGEVGEQGDGFLGFVRPATDATLRGAVAEINAGRAEVYREAAAKTGVTAAAAGQATAQQLFGRIPAGQFYKPLDGDWTRK
jgi:uncharacterized protein YdbL (DUF1318 family)